MRRQLDKRALGIIFIFAFGVLSYWAQTLRYTSGPQSGWLTAEWLIDYGSGFSRRGLSGSLISKAAALLHAKPWDVVPYVQTCIYGGFVALLYWLIRDRAKQGWYLLLVFSPASIFYHLRAGTAVGRKECILFLLLAIFALQARAGFSRSAHIIFALAGFAATLVHELFVFFLPYFFAAGYLCEGPQRTMPTAAPSGAVRALAGVPVALGSATAAVTIGIFGAELDSDGVCRRLLAQGAQQHLCSGILAWPARSISAEVQYVLEQASTHNYLPIYGASLALSLIPFMWRWISRDHIRKPLHGLAFIATAALVSAPLFLLGVDWGRWLHIHVVGLTILASIVLPPLAGAESNARSGAARPRQIGDLVRARLSHAARRASERPALHYGFSAASAFVALIYLSVWHPPICCTSSMGGGLVARGMRAVEAILPKTAVAVTIPRAHDAPVAQSPAGCASPVTTP